MRRGREPDAGQHLEPEVGGRAPHAAHPVAVGARDHGQLVLAVGVGPADEPGLAVHREEPRRLDVDVERQLRAQRGDPPEHPEPLEQLQLGLGVLDDHRRHVVEHLPHEVPRRAGLRRRLRLAHRSPSIGRDATGTWSYRGPASVLHGGEPWSSTRQSGGFTRSWRTACSSTTSSTCPGPWTRSSRSRRTRLRRAAAGRSRWVVRGTAERLRDVDIDQIAPVPSSTQLPVMTKDDLMALLGRHRHRPAAHARASSNHHLADHHHRHLPLRRAPRRRLGRLERAARRVRVGMGRVGPCQRLPDPLADAPRDDPPP